MSDEVSSISDKESMSMTQLNCANVSDDTVSSTSQVNCANVLHGTVSSTSWKHPSKVSVIPTKIHQFCRICSAQTKR